MAENITQALSPEIEAPASDAKHVSVQQPREVLSLTHVLFLDMVGFSKLHLDDQLKALDQLNAVVRSAKDEILQRYKSSINKMIIRPTGDGMALIFFAQSAIPAVECAVEIAKTLQDEKYNINLRTGLHTGPVFVVKDINKDNNVAGEGINTAQRVMDCGDEGHILLSDKVAYQLGTSEWKDKKLEFLGRVKVKHDQEVELYNLCAEGTGNPTTPQKLQIEEERNQQLKEAKEWQQARDEELRLIKEATAQLAKRLHREMNLKQIFQGATAIFLLIAMTVSLVYLPGLILKPADSFSVAVVTQVSDADPALKNYLEILASNISNKFNLKSDSAPNSLLRSTVLPMSGKSAEIIGQETGAKKIIQIEGKKENDRIKVIVNLLDLEMPHTYKFVDDSVNLADESERLRQSERISNEALSNFGLLPTQKERQRYLDWKSASDAANHPYLEAMYRSKRRKKGDIEEAAKLFMEAAKIDENFVLAHMGIADSYIFLGGVTMSPQTAGKDAKEAIKKALAKAQCDNSTSPPPLCERLYSTNAWIHFWILRDLKEAELQFQKANVSSTTDTSIIQRYAAFLAWTKKNGADMALSILQKAIRSETNKDIFTAIILQIHYFNNNPEAVIDYLKNSRNDAATTRRFLALAYERSTQFDKAIEEMEKVDERFPYDYQDARAALGHIYAARKANENDLAEAKKIVEGLTNRYKNKAEDAEYISAYNIALIYAGLDETEKAFYWLKQALTDGDVRRAWLMHDPRLEKLRNELEVREWLKKNFTT